jgi:UDP-N-acetylmuramate--alanine ligase
MGEWDGRRLHFVGIGGAGMSGLALVAQALGAEVSGSDRAESSYLDELRDEGLRPAIGHDAGNLPPGDDVEVVFSTAVTADNVERAEADRRGLRQLHRAELLGEVAGLKRCLAVTGTHGKTTTSAMLVHVLRRCGMDPAFLVGGEPRDTGRNAGWGAGEWLVVEADESDRSLLRLRPEIAVLTNLELDHHTTYSSHLDLERTVRDFLAGADRAVVWDRPELLALRTGPVEAFDVAGADPRPDGVRFTWEGREASVGLPGAHNALNAAAALTAARLAGADPDEAVAALADFGGTRRRFERVGDTAGGAAVYDDYAHHPTEVRATIAAARTLGPRRVVAVFQPHLYSRTAALWREFGGALALADLPVVLDVYRAREDPARWPGVSGRLIAEATADAAGGRTVAWLPGFDDAEPFLRAELREGDLCLVLGAGDVDELGRRLVG